MENEGIDDYGINRSGKRYKFYFTKSGHTKSVSIAKSPRTEQNNLFRQQLQRALRETS